MQEIRLLTLTLYYKPTGKRNRGHPTESWKDKFMDESWWNKFYNTKMQLIQEEEQESQ